MFNNMARPWETRFEEIVTRIHDHARKIQELANAGHLLISKDSLRLFQKGMMTIGQAALEDRLERDKRHKEMRLKFEAMQLQLNTLVVSSTTASQQTIVASHEAHSRKGAGAQKEALGVFGKAIGEKSRADLTA